MTARLLIGNNTHKFFRRRPYLRTWIRNYRWSEVEAEKSMRYEIRRNVSSLRSVMMIQLHRINPDLLVIPTDILILEAFLNNEPPTPIPNQGDCLPETQEEIKLCEAKTVKSSIDEPPEVELKDLPPHLEYAFLEDDNKLPVIIAKELSLGEKADLIKVLKSHKRAIAWKLSDIQGINPEFCTHKILMEEDYKPTVQHQRRVNPKIHDVIKNEVEKLLDAGLIYPSSDKSHGSARYICVPKKGGFTVVSK
ncbi:hypothetical protein Tco_0682086 [Tanacetum coccineum]|uniref:Reverse transcriptase domain-containing protein n=1 Tax=Tanacetum coccineum TaxID=301880 RepID=A0ABQ4XR64_9ASTR